MANENTPDISSLDTLAQFEYHKQAMILRNETNIDAIKELYLELLALHLSFKKVAADLIKQDIRNGL